MDDLKRCEELVAYARQWLGLKERDELYVTNRLLEILNDERMEEGSEEQIDALYGAMSLTPWEIDQTFQALLQQSAKVATDWFYAYCVHNQYVKKELLDKNPRFADGNLIITINKAKPEFRDAKKAASGNAVAGGYPKCSICRENEGFGGRNKRTLRTVNITLGGQPWFWQYSPYGYFREHGIAVNCQHIPMHIARQTFENLMDFVDIFPHYFIGCNAPLPRIGGSVLAHDHYQGGGEWLPMHKAGAVATLTHANFPHTTIEVVDWQGTVVRVVGKVRAEIVEFCDRLREKWNDYCNPALYLIPYDENGVYHAISPTVIKTERGYEMSVILRSNITSEEFPDGIFHAHPEFHMIKKESIGLIEAQGLFILPGRLEKQLGDLEEVIVSNQPLPAEYVPFKLVYDEVKALIHNEEKALGGNVHKAMQRELGSICNRILQNTAVFKDKNLLVEFLTEMGCNVQNKHN